MALKILRRDLRGPKPVDPVAPLDAGDENSAAPAPARNNLRKKAVPLVLGVAGLALVWFAGDWFLTGRFEITTDNARVRADIANVASRVQGYVETIHVADDQPVKAGDLLVTLEADDLSVRESEARAALAQAEARVTAQEAAIETAIGRSASQRDQLAEARAGADAANADAELAAADAKRYAELAEQGWYPRARVETAVAQERASGARSAQAQAAITSNRSQLISTESAVTQARQELAAAKAAVDAARARLEATGLDVGRAEIRSPIDGIVANRAITQGELLSPGRVAMAIVPVATSYVVANFKETQVERMRPGQRVDLKVDAYPDLKAHGCIVSLAPATGSTFSLIPQDSATGNFTKIVQRVPVRIAIDPEILATGLMRAGILVVATVSTNKTCE